MKFRTSRSASLLASLFSFAAVAGLLPAAAVADVCTIDKVPAATLLLPYFAVDTTADAGEGLNTLFTIHNAAPEPALTNITLWTDWSVPTVTFNVFLTGYDVVSIDLWDVIVKGNIPITADKQSDPMDTISPAGTPAWDGSFNTCDRFFPAFVNPVISGAIADRVLNGHTGNFVAAVNGCMGQKYGEVIARGYVTVDMTQECSNDFAGDPGYFDNGWGTASNKNQLWGDSYFVDPQQDSLTTQSLVSIEASDAFNADNGVLAPSNPPNPTNATFYGRLTQDEGGNDNREPLGTVWGAAYRMNGPTESSSIIAWRDTTSASLQESFACGVGPDWNGMDQMQVVCFDEKENFAELCVKEECFPLATQRVDVGAQLKPPFDSGWCYLNLNNDDNMIADVDFPQGVGLGHVVQQSYVAAEVSTAEQWSGGLTAVELSHACEDKNPVVQPQID